MKKEKTINQKGLEIFPHTAIKEQVSVLDGCVIEIKDRIAKTLMSSQHAYLLHEVLGSRESLAMQALLFPLVNKINFLNFASLFKNKGVTLMLEKEGKLTKDELMSKTATNEFCSNTYEVNTWVRFTHPSIDDNMSYTLYVQLTDEDVRKYYFILKELIAIANERDVQFCEFFTVLFEALTEYFLPKN